MKEYFSLQFTRLNRHLSDFGLHPVLGWILMLVFFPLLSHLFFSRVAFAGYIYAAFSLGAVARLSERRRWDFLIVAFKTGRRSLIRLAENGIVALPFLVVLLLKGWLIAAAGLAALSAAMAFLRFRSSFGFVIPTPFGRRPFEFTVGFRRTFLLFPLAYFVTWKAIEVGNTNLGLFSLLLVYLVCMTYYSQPEREEFVWIYSLTPAKFLLRKAGTALLFSTALSLPAALGLCIWGDMNVLLIPVVMLVGCLYVINMLLAKYSAFPDPMHLPQAVIIAFSLFMPPVLLLSIPFLWSQSLQKLKASLKDP